MWPAVEPRTSRGQTWRTELPWHYTDDYARLFRRMLRAERGRDSQMLGELEALRLVRTILPEIRTRRQLFVAAAWQPFKWPKAGGGHVSYDSGGLEQWARAKAAGKPAPWEAAQKRRAA